MVILAVRGLPYTPQLSQFLKGGNEIDVSDYLVSLSDNLLLYLLSLKELHRLDPTTLSHGLC